MTEKESIYQDLIMPMYVAADKNLEVSTLIKAAIYQIKQYQRRIEQLEKERDTAVEDLKLSKECESCIHFKTNG